MLFGCRDGEQRLLDIGSRAHGLAASSFLGELDAVIWACKRTKACWGLVPLVICTDSHSLYAKAKLGILYDPNIRALKRWVWLVANESGFQIEFVPGVQNRGGQTFLKTAEFRNSVVVCPCFVRSSLSVSMLFSLWL